MSVDNFDGDGTADQPSIIYGFRNDDGSVEVRELARSTIGELDDVALGGDLTRRGDVIKRDTTKSSLTDRLPDLDLPGQDGLAREDCGDDIPAFYCEDCGNPIYVGRTCGSPTCERCWAAAIKSKTVRAAAKLEGLKRALYARYNACKDIDFNHVIASVPRDSDFVIDSAQTKERAMLIVQTLLEENWGIEGMLIIYHPYRIKSEYRKDQYDHGGEPGRGDMVWSDLTPAPDPEYITFSPHFHVFFPAPRRSFDYSVSAAVEDESGWMFHRVEKPVEDDHTSVEDFDDLVHQITYCFSHAGLEPRGGRMELASRMKGDLHNINPPGDGTEETALAIFCDAAPKLLGVKFANVHRSTCDAEVSAVDAGDWTPDEDEDVDTEPSLGERPHPIEDLYDHAAQRVQSGGPDSRSLDVGVPPEDGSGVDRDDLWSVAPSGSSPSSATDTGPSEADESSPVKDDREVCGGDLAPIREAEEHLEDAEWCRQAEYVGGLRTAFAEWRRRTDGEEELPWLDEDGGVIESD